MLRDFLFFLRALWRAWRVLLTGGSIMAILWLATSLGNGKPIPQSVNWLIVGLTLMLAGFFAWRAEWINAGQWFVDIDFTKVKQIHSGRTAPQIKQLLRPYIGKRMKATGSLEEITASGGPGMFPTDVLLYRDDGVHVHAYVFPWNWSFNGISAFPKGATITVSGRINALGSSSVFLSSCELIKAELPQANSSASSQT